MLTNYVPVSTLVDAARKIQRRPDDPKARLLLERALGEIDEAQRERDAYGEEIAEARDRYADDECEIDDEPLVSVADEGIWVSAWVWIAFPTEAED